ncbi:MAG: formate dehydrogenase accessory sulfurtransferase FdhD [Pyrinomonadaceae bacterium]
MRTAPALFQAKIRSIVANGPAKGVNDTLAVEEPLEIRVGLSENGRRTHKAISITMRTPGDDAELAAGFLFTEGIIKAPSQIAQITRCGRKNGKALHPTGRDPGPNLNTIRVDLHDEVAVDLQRLQRHFYTSSSCGVCGKSSIEALFSGAKRLADKTGPKLASAVIHHLPAGLQASQNGYERTGGLHASALFSATGELEIVREDVGRHNALDKVIGARFLAGETSLSDTVLLVSGRASFELVQKALMAGIPILAAVGAPSSLAVELAAEFGMTLVGFVRDGRFNIYCGSERIISDER